MADAKAEILKELHKKNTATSITSMSCTRKGSPSDNILDSKEIIKRKCDADVNNKIAITIQVDTLGEMCEWRKINSSSISVLFFN